MKILGEPAGCMDTQPECTECTTTHATSASPPTPFFALLLRLIKTAAAALDACLETRSRSEKLELRATGVRLPSTGRSPRWASAGDGAAAALSGTSCHRQTIISFAPPSLLRRSRANRCWGWFDSILRVVSYGFEANGRVCSQVQHVQPRKIAWS